jgi:hypothetical protein
MIIRSSVYEVSNTKYANPFLVHVYALLNATIVLFLSKQKYNKILTFLLCCTFIMCKLSFPPRHLYLSLKYY